MLNSRCARSRVVNGRVMAVTRGKRQGHAIFGPYEKRPSGAYRVEFELCAAGAAKPGADGLCAELQVVGEGDVVLANRHVRVSEIATEPRVFALDFQVSASTRLEYRVWVAGLAPLAIDPAPRAERIGDAPPLIDLARLGIGETDPAALQAEVLAVMRLLRPSRLRDHGKVRVGRDNDGGYVQVDDHVGLDTAFSFGINDDISWDLDMAARGLTIHQFDHTVADPAPDDPRMIFRAEEIAVDAGAGRATLPDLVRTHDKGRERPNIVLKMDIEGGEWGVLDHTDGAQLARLSQIVCELHSFQDLWNERWRRDLRRVFTKLNEHFAVVHVHGNVFGGVSCVAGVAIPNVLEVTWANRALYPVEPTDELFPGPLDMSCDPREPDLYLGRFAF